MLWKKHNERTHRQNVSMGVGRRVPSSLDENMSLNLSPFEERKKRKHKKCCEVGVGSLKIQPTDRLTD